MSKYIDADEFIREYNGIDLRPYINKGYAQQIDGYEMWEKWKIEFDRNVRQIVARLLTEREDEDKIIARVKDIPIMPVPTADVAEVKHGKWEIIDYDDGEYEFHCSNCRSQFDMVSKTNFCPNCGADMRERKDEEDD